MWTRQFIVVFYILFECIILGTSQRYTDPINTDKGTVIGRFLRTVLNSVEYYAFQGIPYAEPPVKNLRFQPPQPKQPWVSPWYATSERDMCIQMMHNQVVGSEDCLYLNVYVPNVKSESLRAVMVWIHGGGFTTGSSNSTYYGPDYLLESDVIVVSLQYRLGALGFLNLNHPDASGNYGLKDQNLALKWIQKNIYNFGGDPTKVTLFGHGSGGVSVDFHQLSEMSEGLFDQTISMSGSPLCIYWAFQSTVEAENQAFLLAHSLDPSIYDSKDKEQMLKILYNADADFIVRKTSQLPLIPFRPTLERINVAGQPKFLTECSPSKYKSGHYNRVRHLMGYTTSEILPYAKTLDDLIKFYINAMKIFTDLNKLARLPVIPELLSSASQIDTAVKVTETVLIQLTEALSDIYFVTGIDKKQQLLSKKNGHPIYYYHFTYKSDYTPYKTQGVEYLKKMIHEDELSYIFYRSDVEIPSNHVGVEIMRDRLVRLWTNFAKYGNPTPHGHNDRLLSITWPDSTRSGKHLEIGDSLALEGKSLIAPVNFYELIGLGDSSVFNDCNKNAVTDFVNNFVNFPANLQHAITHPLETFKRMPKMFG